MNPIYKTLVTNVLGVAGAFAAAAVDGALQHPTGGLLANLQAHPDQAALYVAIANLAHNWISSRYPAAAPAK